MLWIKKYNFTFIFCGPKIVQTSFIDIFCNFKKLLDIYPDIYNQTLYIRCVEKLRNSVEKLFNNNDYIICLFLFFFQVAVAFMCLSYLKLASSVIIVTRSLFKRAVRGAR